MIYNENGKDNGLIISVYTQGNQYIANITNDKLDAWYELRLHYSVTTKTQVKEWAMEYAEGERFELRF